MFYNICVSGEYLSPGCKKITSKVLALMDHGQDYCEHFHKEICQRSKIVNENNLDLTEYFTQLESYLLYSAETKSINHATFLNIYRSCLKYNMEFDFQERMRFGEFINKISYLVFRALKLIKLHKFLTKY